MKKYGIRLGIAVVVVAVIAGIAVSSNQGRVGAVKNGTQALGVPAQNAATGFVGWLEGIYGYMFRYDQLATENEELKIQVTELKNTIREAKAAETENQNLRQLLELSEKHSDFVYELATVTSRESSNWSSTITISKGKEGGIEVGDCAVDSAHNLVGLVTEVGTGWATIRTVVDTDTRVGVLVGDGGSAAVVTGDYAMMQKGQVKLSYLSEDSQVFEGDVLITSGKGSTFPKSLVVGRIASVQTEAGGQLEYANVSPACDLGALSQLFIIKEFKVIE